MYRMLLQGSPWENSVSFLPNSNMVFATPAEVRKASASKWLGFLFSLACFFFITLTSCFCAHPGGRGLWRTLDRQITGQIRRPVERFWLLGAQHRRGMHTPSRVGLSSSASSPLNYCHTADPKG